MSPIKLSKLLYHFYDATLYDDPEVTGLAVDSRQVQKGYLFFACKGTKLDGRNFIEDAINNGAVAVLEDVDSTKIPMHSQQQVPVFPADHLSQRIGKIAATFYDNPSEKFKMVGITGTNGKTSCSYFIAEALEACKITCGIIGTLGNGLYGHIKEGSMTTPDAITLQSLLADFVKHKAQAVAMEVSSHSIDQGRINGIQFEVSIFTNLTRDHLDYHVTMEAYGAAKRKLFENITAKYAVINADDNFGFEMLESLERDNLFAYTLNKNLRLSKLKKENIITADQIRLTLAGIHTRIISPWGEGEVTVPLIGQFNLSNVLATLATLCLLKIPFEKALKVLNQLHSVPGRMQTFGGKDNLPLVVVDYAHTPDALEKVLIALRAHCEGQLLCLFGCGGDRDNGKRPIMATIAEQHADYIVVTDDNPRTEDPEKITNDIMKGFSTPKKVKIQHDRSKAIQDIIQYAKSKDCVLIAGKGAETYQVIGTEKIPFSDIDKVLENLNARMAQ